MLAAIFAEALIPLALYVKGCKVWCMTKTAKAVNGNSNMTTKTMKAVLILALAMAAVSGQAQTKEGGHIKQENPRPVEVTIVPRRTSQAEVQARLARMEMLDPWVRTSPSRNRKWFMPTGQPPKEIVEARRARNEAECAEKREAWLAARAERKAEAAKLP